MKKRVLVTGANGFVGKALINKLLNHSNFTPVGSLRSLPDTTGKDLCAQIVVVPGLNKDTCWKKALLDVSVVIHCAARVHMVKDLGNPDEKLNMYRQVNVDGTLNLARQAAQAGVSRFIFVSSIKVNGEFTLPNRPFHASDTPAPLDPYGLSKLEAEVQLQALCKKTEMELVIVRPPLVYGPGVKANFATLIRCVSRGLPLPLGSVHDNRRSFVALENLVDLLVVCIDHPGAANKIFLVSDDEDLSTSDLIHRIARALGKRAYLLPVPVKFLQACASVAKRSDASQRLLGNLQVDITQTRELLGWHPPITVDDGLRLAVQEFLQ